ncbi:hypothetical protein LWI28_024007 [Acer negundo]|uniref:UDP-glycosyltransferases domain-containing protein n=1 Tax=Acer negundo TaxID=4023 RepID=A0AAD5JMP8_ACENE|nr:hypothetical protein LWI28_024007 [Acer negundo]
MIIRAPPPIVMIFQKDSWRELERERGVMIRGWAPQAEVLAHKAIGGFVSHCGWNSIMESLWHGVPIVTWPLYAEQHFNAFTLVKALRLSVEIMRSDSRKDHDDGDDHIVMGDEITRVVRYVMDGLKPNLLLIGPNPGPTDSGRPIIPHQNHRLTQSNFHSNSTTQTNV